MADFAIRVRGLGKSYRVGGAAQPYRTMRDLPGEILAGIRGRLGNQEAAASRERQAFWALKDLSLDVRAGEVAGIIGRNGAGKSTLLKVLSRVTNPTVGSVEMRGRVGSLLEVGTGFHPELSGRENIQLSGAILGMPKSVIDRKFDEIVAFAEVERFIDTPVKHYSSGMYLRLGFAVAAHMETEIILVDEVLAVGDAGFQKKSLERMSRVAREGRTVLFVSHNMALIQQLCPRSFLLSGGTVVQEGPSREVIQSYLSTTYSGSIGDLTTIADRGGLGALRYRSIHFEDQHGRTLTKLPSGRAVRMVMRFTANEEHRRIRTCLSIYDKDHQRVLYLNSVYAGQDLDGLARGDELICEVPRLNLTPGRYRVGLWVQSSGSVVQDRISDAGSIDVVDGGFFQSGVASTEKDGVALTDHVWSVRSPGAHALSSAV